MQVNAPSGTPIPEEDRVPKVAGRRMYRTRLVGPRADCDALRTRRGRGTPKQRVVFHDRSYVQSEGSSDEEDINLPMIYHKKKCGLEETDQLLLRTDEYFARRHYFVQSPVGSGHFSNVYKVGDTRDDSTVVMKILRNRKEAFDAGMAEIRVLRRIQKNEGEGKAHLLSLIEYFYHREHLVIVTEAMCGSLINLAADLQSSDPAQGGLTTAEYFTPHTLAHLMQQMLSALAFMQAHGMIHADVKPENIGVASASMRTFKLLDFNSAMYEGDPCNSYAQSRWYRAPEVALGLPWAEKIDSWSLGVVVVGVLLEEALFGAGESVAALLASHAAVCGPFPPQMIATTPEVSSMFFAPGGGIYEIDPPNGPTGVYVLEPAADASLSTLLGPATSDAPGLMDLVTTLLTLDPAMRPNASEALQHSWLEQAMSAPSTRDVRDHNLAKMKMAQDPLLARYM